MKIWRTPDAHCNKGPSSEKRMKMKLEKKMPISINDQVASEFNVANANNTEIEHPKMKLTKTGRRLTKDGKNSHKHLADTVKMWNQHRLKTAQERENESTVRGANL